jgi:hypothetical protein
VTLYERLPMKSRVPIELACFLVLPGGTGRWFALGLRRAD